MNSSPRIPPRFLPTLTEVVQAPPALQPDASANAKLDPLIEQQVRELVRTLFAEQLDSLRAALEQPKGESADK
jgi:hypothetical protein